MKIGPHTLPNNLILAPMAGITDRPFRTLCKEFGAGLTVSEMITAKPVLQNNKKTLLKADHHQEPGIHSVQILGTDPKEMAQAAKLNVERGADIIDINMGCPAKKVCSVAAGSALLKNEKLVRQILETVVAAVDVPVTLKIRTGWDKTSKNALAIAQIAENAGISALAIHGRTRACKFDGNAEYETIRLVKQSVNIPIIANGDITSVKKAQYVLQKTGADAVMIGRGAQGKPWIFSMIDHFFKTGKTLKNPELSTINSIMFKHLDHLYSFYGYSSGVRIARKHIGWYLNSLGGVPTHISKQINQAQLPTEQLTAVNFAISHLINDQAA